MGALHFIMETMTTILCSICVGMIVAIIGLTILFKKDFKKYSTLIDERKKECRE